MAGQHRQRIHAIIAAGAAFIVLPRRWIVERTLAWISRNRRLARHFERYAQSPPSSCSP
jgi:transposase